jgi:hypothetical protein
LRLLVRPLGLVAGGLVAVRRFLATFRTLKFSTGFGITLGPPTEGTLAFQERLVAMPNV